MTPDYEKLMEQAVTEIGACQDAAEREQMTAALHVFAAKLQGKSSRKLECFTRWLIMLTLALVGLTFFLCVDAYFSHHDITGKGKTVSHDYK